MGHSSVGSWEGLPVDGFCSWKVVVGSWEGCQLNGFCSREVVVDSWEWLPGKWILLLGSRWQLGVAAEQIWKERKWLWVKPLIPVFDVARTGVLADLRGGLHQRRTL